MSEMPVQEGAASMWRFSTIDARLASSYPLALAGQPEPLSVYLDFDAEKRSLTRSCKG